MVVIRIGPSHNPYRSQSWCRPSSHKLSHLLPRSLRHRESLLPRDHHINLSNSRVLQASGRFWHQSQMPPPVKNHEGYLFPWYLWISDRFAWRSSKFLWNSSHVPNTVWFTFFPRATFFKINQSSNLRYHVYILLTSYLQVSSVCDDHINLSNCRVLQSSDDFDTNHKRRPPLRTSREIFISLVLVDIRPHPMKIFRVPVKFFLCPNYWNLQVVQFAIS